MVAAEVADAVVEGALAADGHPPAVHAAARQVHRQLSLSPQPLAMLQHTRSTSAVSH